jgi:hypothetical protein
MSLPRLTSLCHSSLSTSRLVAPTLTNCMQPPWYNSDEM